MVFRRCRGPGASRLQILLSKLCSSGAALCRCPPHCRPWSPSPSHTCSLLQVQHRPKPQLSHASYTVYSTYCSPALFYSRLTCRVSFTLTGFSDSPDYSFMLWCELYYLCDPGVISSTGIFVAIAKNICMGQNNRFFFYD